MLNKIIPSRSAYTLLKVFELDLLQLKTMSQK